MAILVLNASWVGELNGIEGEGCQSASTNKPDRRRRVMAALATKLVMVGLKTPGGLIFSVM